MKQKKVKPYKGFSVALKKLYGKSALHYGPYIRNKDGRKIVVIKTRSGLTTKLYAKVKLEIKLKRRLSKDDTVDHLDGDHTNDKFSNLVLLTRSLNAYKSSIQREKTKVPCAWCHHRFVPTKDQVKTRAQKTAGPFCSKSCSGSYGSSVRDTGRSIKRKQIVVKYVTLNASWSKTEVSARVSK